MAIVQISRIQHRRGRGNPPQLASGEIAWSIDNQQLYIGNGAVSEGAPYVGNTEILTEHSNIFDLADQYAYRPNSNIWGINVPLARSLQDRLDETVSVFSFGATGNGSDQTAEIQLAIDTLFKNSSAESKVILWFPAGVYKVSNVLEIPPYAVIRGAGKEKTTIISDVSDVFKTVHYNPNNPTELLNEVDEAYIPKYIEILDLTIKVNDSTKKGLIVDSCQLSIFRNLKIIGPWEFGDSSVSLGIELLSNTDVKLTKNNIFDGIEIDNFYFGIYSDYYIKNNNFTNLRLESMVKGIVFGEDTSIGLMGMKNGPSYNLIQSSVFDRIDEEAIYVKVGDYNLSRDNRFFNVGNDQSNSTSEEGFSSAIARSSVIKFVTNTNLSSSDFFDRTQSKTPYGITPTDATKFYTPEVSGRVNYSNLYGNSITIGVLASEAPILKLPVVDNGTVFVDYVYTEESEDIVREGTLEIVINLSDNAVVLNDNYTFMGDSGYASALVFTANLETVTIPSAATTKIVNLSAVNTIPVSNDNFYYTIRVKS